MSGSVSREAKELLERKLSDVERSEAALKLEVLRLKDVAEMAKEQTALLTLQEQLKNNELTSLQQQLLEHQTKSDDKATIGMHCSVFSCLDGRDTMIPVLKMQKSPSRQGGNGQTHVN